MESICIGLRPDNSECACNADVRAPEAKQRRTESSFYQGFAVPRLFDLTVDVIAAKIPFKIVEGCYHRREVNDSIVMEVMKKSFPTTRDVIGLVASVSRPKFSDKDFRQESIDCGMIVRDATQTGLSLTGTVVEECQGLCSTGTLVHECKRKDRLNSRKAVVSLLFDRRCITMATCSVHGHRVQWCNHVLRLVEHRISQPDNVVYRLPISFTLERLSLTQMKKFVGSLLTDSAKLLSSANMALRDINTASSASHKTLPSTACVPVTDLTSRGDINDSCTWHLDESQVRHVMKRGCGGTTFVEGGRRLCLDQLQEEPLDRWQFVLKQIKMRSRAQVNVDADGRLRWSVKDDELECLFSIIEHLLKSGDSTVLQVLDLLTEQWFGMMEKVVRLVRRYVPWNLARAADDIEAEEDPSMYSQNQDLLLASGRAWFIPDRLATCWRFAVLSPFYSEDVIERLRHRLIQWAIRIRKASTEGRHLYDILVDDLDEAEEHWQDLCTVMTMSSWNGFCHVQAFASPQTRALFHRMPNLDVSLCMEVGPVEGSDESDVLRTASCCVQCLQFYGQSRTATALALQVLVSISSSCVELPPDMARLPSSSSLLAAIKQFQNEIGLHAWGDSDEGANDPTPMTVLLGAIVNDEKAWELNCTVDIKLASSASDSDSDSDSEDDWLSQFSTVPFPVHVFLECINGFTEGSNWARTAPQIDVILEISKLHQDIVDHIISMPASVRENIVQAVEHNMECVLMEGQSTLKLGFLFRLLLEDFNLSFPITLVNECLGNMTVDLSDQESTEEYFLLLTMYSSLLLQSLQLEISLQLDRHSRCSRIAEGVDIAFSNVSHSYWAFSRLQQFIFDMLHIANLICPSLNVDVQDRSLSERLQLLHLPESKPPSDLNDDKKFAAALVAGVLLTRLLQITRQVGNLGTRTNILRALVRISTVIGADRVLEIVTRHDWYCVLSTSEVVQHLLFEVDFAKSFRCRQTENLDCGVEKLVRDIVIHPLYAFTTDDLMGQTVYYESITLLGLIPLLLKDVLTDAQEAWQVNYLILFRLLDSCVNKADAFKIALMAYEAMWTNVVRQGENVIVAHVKRSGRFSTILRGVHDLGAMAMHLDLASTPSGSAVMESMTNTNRVLRLVLEMWVDPIISLHIVAEMARIQSHTSDCEALNPPYLALASFCLRNQLAASVLHRCKAAILAALGEDIHFPYNSREYLLLKPGRDVLGDDLLCLSTILYVFPDPLIDLEALVSHCAVCLWQNAAKSYYRTYSLSTLPPTPSDYYETYYRGLIASGGITSFLFSHLGLNGCRL